jgi:hypothetical protein
MSAPFDLSWQALSCFCLSGLLLIEWLALRTLTHETLLLRHFYEPTPGREDELLSIRVRPFRASMMDCSDVLTDTDLLGRMTTLFFVRPDKVLKQGNEVFGPLLLSLWQKRRGPLHIVCSGSIEDCQLLRDRYQLGRMHNSAIEVVLDERGLLRKSFSVTPALAAVVVDENGKIAKVGGVHSDQFQEDP